MCRSDPLYFISWKSARKYTTGNHREELCLRCGRWGTLSRVNNSKAVPNKVQFLSTKQSKPDAIIIPGADSLLTMFPEAYGFSDTWRWRCREQPGCKQNKGKRALLRFILVPIIPSTLIKSQVTTYFSGDYATIIYREITSVSLNKQNTNETPPSLKKKKKTVGKIKVK